MLVMIKMVMAMVMIKCSGLEKKKEKNNLLGIFWFGD
jgi:hypothetical protein